MSVVVAYFLPVRLLVAVTATPGNGVVPAFTVPLMVPPCGVADAMTAGCGCPIGPPPSVCRAAGAAVAAPSVAGVGPAALGCARSASPASIAAPRPTAHSNLQFTPGTYAPV